MEDDQTSTEISRQNFQQRNYIRFLVEDSSSSARLHLLRSYEFGQRHLHFLAETDNVKRDIICARVVDI
jgi:hypothetical protein